MVLRFLVKITLYQLFWIIFLVFVYIILVLWSEPLPEVEDYTLHNQRYESRPNVTSPTLVPESEYPTIVWWNSNFGSRDRIQCPNNIICENYGQGFKLRQDVGGTYTFYGSLLNFSHLPIPRQGHNILWALLHEESPRNVEMLLHEPVLKLFNFSSTYSRYSDVPFPLANMGSLEDITSKKVYVETSEKNSLLTELAPILYLQSDCETSTERDVYVAELMKYVNIDSYGSCLQNKPKLPLGTEKDYLNNFKDEVFLKFIARYKFHIGIENGVCHDYVTEKFWRPIHVGSVPIYFGSPSVRDWFPNTKSAILVEDFEKPSKLGHYIKRLIENDTMYEEYLEHKTKGVITNQRLIREIKERPYQTRLEQTIQTFECFVCKKLHELRKIPEKHVITKKHYDCPIPISALQLGINPKNPWVDTYYRGEHFSQGLYELISRTNYTESYLNGLAVLFQNKFHLNYYGRK